MFEILQKNCTVVIRGIFKGGVVMREVIIAILVGSSIYTSSLWGEEGCFLRSPDIHKDKIAFVYSGDIWIVPSKGGIARRLTTHIGEEWKPRFSPDGKWIAFSGEYDGNLDLYVIPVEGGEPKRLTFHPSSDGIVDWYPDGEHILFLSPRNSFIGRFNRLFKISPEGGFPAQLPLPEASLASLSSDGKKIAYNRLPSSYHWREYKGGLASDIWLYNFDLNTIEQITKWEGIDVAPMWAGDKIYFASERGGRVNIFFYDLRTKAIQRVTDYKDYDLHYPSIGPDAIVYEYGGYLYRLDLVTEATEKLTIELPGDRRFTRPSYKKVDKLVRGLDISPSGKRVVFEARGDIFTVPEEKGDIRNITQTPGIRETYPAWSPDGKWIAYLSDRTEEYELYVCPQEGSGEEIQLTKNSESFPFPPKWSPDSKKLIYSDNKLRLFYIDVKKKRKVLVDSSEVDEIRVYEWSPDSKWIGYVKEDENWYGSIYLYSLASKKVFRITKSFNDDDCFCFDPEGKYLYFVSSRTFEPYTGDFWQFWVFPRTKNLYVITLQADSLSPFAPESDEERGEVKKEEGKKEESEKEGKKKPKEIKIDFQGIDQRIVGVPIDPGNYRNLSAIEGKILYRSLPAGKRGREKPEWELHLYDIKEREDHTILRGINEYALSHNGKKIIYKSKDTYGIITTEAKEHKVGDGKLKTSELELKVCPREEWTQMFREAWRVERDFFYDPNIHGIDWANVKKRYEKFLPWVSHRDDLTYLIHYIQRELGTSHAYVGGGDYPEVKEVNVGLLGTDLEPDPKTGFYRFKKIYQGENWKAERRSPLTEPGVVVKEGEYLIAVEEKIVRYPDNPFKYFENLADKQVEIKVNDKPSEKGAREIKVEPISSEQELRYLDWIKSNQHKVEEATHGQVGYVHVPNTSIWGLKEFGRAFLAQSHKEGLIVDVRYNGGGWSPMMFMDYLRREVASWWVPRQGKVGRDPTWALHGHMVCIINEYAGSGGDMFPYYFRQMGLGSLIGKRTWGGLIACSGFQLMDGGGITYPKTRFFNVTGEWDIENYGVDPDIEVDNLPPEVIEGHDPQLERAIEVVMKKIKEKPKILPKAPPPPGR